MTASGAVFLLAGLLVAPLSVGAADWGGIVPGESTTESVRAVYGAPSRTTTQKVEGYDTAQWIYEGTRAPAGMQRMVVEFGLLAQGRLRPEVVRVLRLEPKPFIFLRGTVMVGWGEPARVGKEGDVEVYFYPDGLLVYFDRQGLMATHMVFTPPQPPPGTPPAPPPRR